MDNGSQVRTAHSCQHVQEIYGTFLNEPGEKTSQDMFYTGYSGREVLL
jgi:hypothetical protein